MQSKEAKLTFKTVPWGKLMVYIVFIVVFVLFSVLLHDKGFLGSNLLNIVRQTAMVGVMAVAGTFVIACGQIDLTVGSVAAMSAMIAALILQSTGNIFLAVVVSILFGLGVGWVNGFLVTRLGLPSFLATLGMMEVVRGLAMWITNTAAVPITNNTFNQIFGTGYLDPISVLIVWMVIFFVVGYFLFNKTPFGRHTLAVGGNETAAGYVAVLDRQAQRLKKLTEDVVEASKASSGAINVRLAQLDAAELIRQCAAEYGERFAAPLFFALRDAAAAGGAIFPAAVHTILFAL